MTEAALARMRRQEEVEFAEIDQMLMPEMPVVNEGTWVGALEPNNAAWETNLVQQARR